MNPNQNEKSEGEIFDITRLFVLLWLQMTD